MKYRNDPTDLKGIVEFMELYSCKKGIIVTKDLFDEVDVGFGKVRFIPLWLFLLCNGKMLGLL